MKCRLDLVNRVPDRDILVRTWIRESVPLMNGSGSCSSVNDLKDNNKVFGLLLFEGTRYIYIILQR
jgi:hypothetical protein